MNLRPISETITMTQKSFISVYFNLLKTIIGCGMLSYPILFKKYGLLRTVFLTIISGMFSGYGLLLYASVNKKIGKKSNMSSISAHIYPPIKVFIDICVSLKCYAVGILFCTVMKNLCAIIKEYCAQKQPPVFHFFGNFDHKYLLLGCMALVSPFSFLTNLNQLKYVSIFGIFCVFLMMVSAGFLYFNSPNIQPLEFWPQPKHNLIRDIGQFVYGFTCHQNIFTIQNEQGNMSIRFLSIVITSVIITTYLIYLIYGYLIYAIFGAFLDQETLTAMRTNSNAGIICVFVLYLVMIGLSIPLQTNPCRLYFMSLFNKDPKKDRKFSYIFTAMVLTSTYLLAVIGPQMATMANYIGGSVSSCICFIFGSIYYLKLSQKNQFFTMIAYSTLFFGIFAISCFVYDTIFRLIEK